MELPWASLQGFAGAAGVGSLAVLGIFLAVDSLHHDVLPVLEFYAKTATWAIVAAIPAAAIAYVLGLLLIGAGGLLLDILPAAQSAERYEDLVKIGDMGSGPVIESYQQLIQESQILAGSSLALVLIAVGAALDAKNLPSLRRLIYGGAFFGIVVAALVFLLGVSKSRSAHSLSTLL